MRLQHDTHPIAAIARRQKGLVTTAELYAAGFTQGAVARLVRRGWLHPWHRGVFAVGHTALTLDARYLAAVLAVGDRAVLSDRAAAALWQILPPHPALHVTVPTYAGHPHRDGIRVHRRVLRDDEIEVRRDIRCTSLVRTVMDLAATAPRLLNGAFEEAQVQHKLNPSLLAAAVVTRPGHRGTARLRVLLDGAVDPGEVQSILELRFLKLCRDFDLPRPETQHWIAGWHVDFYFPEWRLVIETDGGRYHASAAKRKRDARKTTDLEAHGETVLRLRWADVVDTPAAVAAQITPSVAGQSHRGC